MSQLLHQAELDVERLRKAAERIDQLRVLERVSRERLAVATNALKTIHIWAMNVRDEKDIRHIADRARDVLLVCGCMGGGNGHPRR